MYKPFPLFYRRCLEEVSSESILEYCAYVCSVVFGGKEEDLITHGRISLSESENFAVEFGVDYPGWEVNTGMEKRSMWIRASLPIVNLRSEDLIMHDKTKIDVIVSDGYVLGMLSAIAACEMLGFSEPWSDNLSWGDVGKSPARYEIKGFCYLGEGKVRIKEKYLSRVMGKLYEINPRSSEDGQSVDSGFE